VDGETWLTKSARSLAKISGRLREPGFTLNSRRRTRRAPRRRAATPPAPSERSRSTQSTQRGGMGEEGEASEWVPQHPARAACAAASSGDPSSSDDSSPPVAGAPFAYVDGAGPFPSLTLTELGRSLRDRNSAHTPASSTEVGRAMGSPRGGKGAARGGEERARGQLRRQPPSLHARLQGKRAERVRRATAELRASPAVALRRRR